MTDVEKIVDKYNKFWVEKILLDIVDKYNKFWEDIRKEYKFKEGDFHFKILQGYIEIRARKFKKGDKINGT